MQKPIIALLYQRFFYLCSRQPRIFSVFKKRWWQWDLNKTDCNDADKICFRKWNELFSHSVPEKLDNIFCHCRKLWDWVLSPGLGRNNGSPPSVKKLFVKWTELTTRVLANFSSFVSKNMPRNYFNEPLSMFSGYLWVTQSPQVDIMWRRGNSVIPGHSGLSRGLGMRWDCRLQPPAPRAAISHFELLNLKYIWEKWRKKHGLAEISDIWETNLWAICSVFTLRLNLFWD